MRRVRAMLVVPLGESVKPFLHRVARRRHPGTALSGLQCPEEPFDPGVQLPDTYGPSDVLAALSLARAAECRSELGA